MILWHSVMDLFDLISYVDDYARYIVDRKIISEMSHFLRPYLVSWKIKK